MKWQVTTIILDLSFMPTKMKPWWSVSQHETRQDKHESGELYTGMPFIVVESLTELLDRSHEQ